MASLNSVNLIGRVGKDPETRQFDNGNRICTFSLATSEVYTDRQGQRQEQTEWHNIVLNGKLADLSQYIHKGSMLYIGGKIRTRSWETDGGTRYTTEIVGLSLQLLDPKPQSQQTAPAPQYAPRQAPAQPMATPAQPIPQYQSAPVSSQQYQPQYQATPATAPAPQAYPQYQQAPSAPAPDQDLPF